MSGPGPRHLLAPRPDPILLSLVIPAYNEEAVIPLLRQRLTEFMSSLPYPVETIIINDGSRDGTLDLLAEWAAVDRRLKILGLARNFGHQAAITAGLDAAAGDAVVILDADLQDPPEVVADMLAKYRQGYDVVIGQRLGRDGESFFKRATAWSFYRLMRLFIHPDLPPDAGDFRLISRRCLDALRAMRETHRFLRGMVAWTGFAQTAVPYRRQARAAGRSNYSLWKMIRFAWTAAVSFSPAPLRLILAGGLFVALIGLTEGAYAVARALIKHDTQPGWTSMIAITCLIGGAILTSIGVLGEYVSRIFEQGKGRPLYLVSTAINLDPPHPGAQP